MEKGIKIYLRIRSRETLIKAFSAPDLRCETAYSSANPCASSGREVIDRAKFLNIFRCFVIGRDIGGIPLIL